MEISSAECGPLDGSTVMKTLAKSPGFRRRSKLIAMALMSALLVVGGTTIMVAPTAASAAPSCSGSGCNGQDPYATGCAQNAREITTAGRNLSNGNTNFGVIHLFWSWRCQTNWPVVTAPQSCYNIKGTSVEANVESLSNPGQWVAYTVHANNSPTYVWGNMVYSPGPAQGFGQIDCNGPIVPWSGLSGVA